MYYSENYLKATQLADRILTESDVAKYPLNPVELALKNNIRIITYRDFSRLCKIPEKKLIEISPDGFSVRFQQIDFIVYNPQIASKGRRRWTLIHEFCHIKLGHVKEKNQILPTYSRKRYLEAEANELACCLIAPLPVILMCDIDNEEDLKRVFGLSSQAAANIFADYQKMLSEARNPKMGYLRSLPRLQEFATQVIWSRQMRRCHRPHTNLNVHPTEADIYLR